MCGGICEMKSVDLPQSWELFAGLRLFLANNSRNEGLFTRLVFYSFVLKKSEIMC